MVNTKLLDRWTLIHCGVGSLLTVSLWALKLNWWSVLVVAGLECLWEIFENNDIGIKFWHYLNYNNYKGDSVAHTAIDFILTSLSSALTALIAYEYDFDTALIASLSFSGAALLLFVLFFLIESFKIFG